MANTALNITAPVSFLNVISAPFVAIGNALVAVAEASSRTEEIEFLQSQTDEELAARGLTRDEIVRHVFADKLAM